MKNLVFSLSFFFSFSNFLVAQELGDQKPQVEVFGKSHPTWPMLTGKDTIRKMRVSDYFNLQPGEKILCWNAITGRMAEVQAFSPQDYILVLTRPDGTEFLYKVGCKNRLRYIKILRNTQETAPAPAPEKIYIRDTVYKEIVVIEKEIIHQEPSRRRGGMIHGGGVITPNPVVIPPRTYNPCTGGWDGPRRWDLQMR